MESDNSDTQRARELDPYKDNGIFSLRQHLSEQSQTSLLKTAHR